jgi:hypothetical protein
LGTRSLHLLLRVRGPDVAIDCGYAR